MSSDPDGQITHYEWIQTAGPAITLEQGNGSASFTAPESAGVVTISLKVTDNSGATATSTRDVTVVAATGGRSKVELVSARLGTSVLSPGSHTDYSPLEGSPGVGQQTLAMISLGGPVETVAFSLVSDADVALGDLALEAVSDRAVQPTSFVGEFTVPAQAFKIRAVGRSSRNEPFDLVSTTFNPSRLTLQFDPKVIRGSSGSVRAVRLNITNDGDEGSFSIQIVDPANVVGQPAASTRTIRKGETVSIELQARVPAISNAFETIEARVNSSNDGNSQLLRVWPEIAL